MEVFGFVGIGKHLKLDKKVIRFFLSELMAILSTISRFPTPNCHFPCDAPSLVLVAGFLHALESWSLDLQVLQMYLQWRFGRVQSPLLKEWQKTVLSLASFFFCLEGRGEVTCLCFKAASDGPQVPTTVSGLQKRACHLTGISYLRGSVRWFWTMCV